MEMVHMDTVDVDPIFFAKFHIFGKFTKDHLTDLSSLLGLVFGLWPYHTYPHRLPKLRSKIPTLR